MELRIDPLGIMCCSLTHKGGGKNASQLMQLIDQGSCVIKGDHARGWGRNLHFPVILTSNQTPYEFATGRNNTKAGMMNSDQVDAFLNRIVVVQFQ